MIEGVLECWVKFRTNHSIGSKMVALTYAKNKPATEVTDAPSTFKPKNECELDSSKYYCVNSSNNKFDRFSDSKHVVYAYKRCTPLHNCVNTNFPSAQDQENLCSAIKRFREAVISPSPDDYAWLCDEMDLFEDTTSRDKLKAIPLFNMTLDGLQESTTSPYLEQAQSSLSKSPSKLSSHISLQDMKVDSQYWQPFLMERVMQLYYTRFPRYTTSYDRDGDIYNELGIMTGSSHAVSATQVHTSPPIQPLDSFLPNEGIGQSLGENSFALAHPGHERVITHKRASSESSCASDLSDDESIMTDDGADGYHVQRKRQKIASVQPEQGVLQQQLSFSNTVGEESYLVKSPPHTNAVAPNNEPPPILLSSTMTGTDTDATDDAEQMEMVVDTTDYSIQLPSPIPSTFEFMGVQCGIFDYWAYTNISNIKGTKIGRSVYTAIKKGDILAVNGGAWDSESCDKAYFVQVYGIDSKIGVIDVKAAVLTLFDTVDFTLDAQVKASQLQHKAFILH